MKKTKTSPTEEEEEKYPKEDQMPKSLPITRDLKIDLGRVNKNEQLDYHE